MATRVTLLACCRSCSKSFFDSGEVLEPFFFLLVKIDVVDDVVEVSDAGIDDSSVER